MQVYIEGDRSSIELLISEFYPNVMGYLLRMSGDFHLTEDLTQETFWRLFHHADKYKYPMPVKPWILKIAGNLLRDHFKKKESSTIRMPFADEMISSGVMVEEVCIQREEESLVADNLLMVKDVFREVLVLRYLQSMSLEEIALVLDIPKGTVKSRLFRGLYELKSLLEKGGYRDV